MNDSPLWMGTALIAAGIATLGYVGKMILESWVSFRDTKMARRSQLVELQSMLWAAWVSVSVPNTHAKRLVAMIKENSPDLLKSEEGYERNLAIAFPQFTPEQKELRAIIRSININSLRPNNQSLLKWLKNDTYFKAQQPERTIYFGEGCIETSRA